MNVECSQSVLDELKHVFRFNDAILRHLILSREEAVTQPSPMTQTNPTKSSHHKKPRKAAVIEENVESDEAELEIEENLDESETIKE